MGKIAACLYSHGNESFKRKKNNEAGERGEQLKQWPQAGSARVKGPTHGFIELEGTGNGLQAQLDSGALTASRTWSHFISHLCFPLCWLHSGRLSTKIASAV